MKNRIASIAFLSCSLIFAKASAGTNQISVSGSPGTMTITTAVPGSQPTSVTNTATTWSVQTNAATHTVTAVLSSALATGITLSLNMSPPPGGVSQGTIALSTTSQTMVTNVQANSTQTQGLTYTLAANVSAGVITLASTVVTLTLN